MGGGARIPSTIASIRLIPVIGDGWANDTVLTLYNTAVVGERNARNLVEMRRLVRCETV